MTRVFPNNKETDLMGKDSRLNEQTEFNMTSNVAQDKQALKFLPRIKGKLLQILDSNTTTIVMTTATIYALFGDDIRYAGFSKSADDVFYSLASICLFLFLVELILSFWVKTDYRWNFYFFLDAIATISLIPDIGWIWFPLVGIEEDQGGNSDTEQIQNAGKASRAGTRTSRVIRIIRLIRLIRIVKLYKSAKQAMKEDIDDDDQEAQEIPSESKVGKKLSDLTTKRVIILVLLMLFILPFFENEFYVEYQTSWDFGLSEVHYYYGKSGFEEVYNEYISYHRDRIRPIIFISYEDNGETIKWESGPSPDDLRFDEKHYASETDMVAVFDLREDTRLNAYLNICKTVFVCIVLTLGALYFTNDANRLVIEPIEKMIDRVKKIAKNPISASQENDINIYDIAKQDEKRKWCGCCKPNITDEAEYETSLIENTITKIGVLLAIGFGEAGAAIIGTNIEKGGDIDPMLEGNKVVAIFGFCDIRNFTDTTEELLEGVMVFVNEIAQIVHRTVNKYQGAANKNIGDAFLLVWKFNELDYYVQDNAVVANSSSKKAQYVPDLALLAFVKVLAKINRDNGLLEYRKNPKLNSRIPNYAVKMGFGLHIGWGIEGAIGSEFKIDASYLSPHVNIASRLEAATKQYGVPLLISGEMYDACSDKIKEYMRHIDTVTVKGSKQPMRLYTSDLDTSQLTPSKTKPQTKEMGAKAARKLRRALEKDETTTAELFEKSYSVQKMREFVDPGMMAAWDKGMKAYIDGQWNVAEAEFRRCLAQKSNDGPSLCLLDVIAEHNGKAPEDWDGYRVLTEK